MYHYHFGRATMESHLFHEIQGFLRFQVNYCCDNVNRFFFDPEKKTTTDCIT